jgi:hypothetical protein
MSDRSFSKNKGKIKRLSLPDVQQGPRLKELATMSIIFKKRFRKASNRRDMTPEYIQKIVESNGFRFYKMEDGTWDLHHPKAGLDMEWPLAPEMPATQLIICLTMAMRTEAHETAFNYFLLHMDCYRVLEEIRKTIDDSTVQWLAPESAKQKHLPSVVAMVFRDAAADYPLGLMQRAAPIVANHVHERSSLESTSGMRDLGFYPCRCPHNTRRTSAATINCRSSQCGVRPSV